MSLEVKAIKITPEKAKDMLEKNSVNRNLNMPRVKQYAADMASGLWQLNGEAIKFYEDGSLADGQHRLNAIVTANIPITTLVITNLPKNVTIQDRGRNRNIADALILEGFPRELANNSNVAVAKLHYSIQLKQANISDGNVRKFLERNGQILIDLACIKSASSRSKQKTLNARSAPMLLAMFYAINSHACDIKKMKEFSDVFSSGIPNNLSQSAALVCRNDILSGAIDIKGGRMERIRSTFQIEKAISDFIQGYKRKITYSNYDTPIYSCLEINKEA